jgi:hypothetical protein
VLIPLGVIFVVFAVANRHAVTVSFDPFNSTDPSLGVRLPLFVVIIAVAILGVVAAAPRPGSGSATGGAPRGGMKAEARQMQAQLADLRAAAMHPARRPAAPFRPVAGRLIWGQWARQAGRDVVERAPSAPLFRRLSPPQPCFEPCP